MYYGEFDWAFPEIFRIPPVEDNGNSKGGLKNENLENSSGLCLKLENSRGVIWWQRRTHFNEIPMKTEQFSSDFFSLFFFSFTSMR